VNYNYEQGQYSTIPFSYDEGTKVLTIGSRKGSYQGMPRERRFEIVWVNNDQPVGMGLAARPDQVITYAGEPLSLKPVKK
jgi:alpha-D-xyloside xylohydrolase